MKNSLFFLIVLAVGKIHHSLSELISSTALPHLQDQLSDKDDSNQIRELTSNTMESKTRLELNDSHGDRVLAVREPTYIQMCNAILSSDKNPGKIQIIKESKEVCQNNTSPYSALLQIFASSFLNEIARYHNINVWYSFHCQKHKSSSLNGNNIFTIQEFLPSPLIVTDDIVTKTDMNDVRKLCEQCVKDYDKKKIPAPGCILFGEDDSSSHMHTISPETKDTNKGVDQRRLEAGESPKNIQTMLPSIQKSLMKAALTAAHTNLIARNRSRSNMKSYKNEPFTTVVYLAHPEEFKQSSFKDDTEDSKKKKDEKKSNLNFDPMTFPSKLFYATEIPRFTDSIEIVSSPSCDICHQQGESLRIYLASIYPRATVINISDPSSAVSMSKMITADLLICPSVDTCLLPSIARNDKYSILAHDGNLISTIDNKQNYAKHPLLKSILPMIRAEHIDPKISESKLHVKIINDTKLGNEMAKNGKCRHIRGRFGQWKQDMKFASKLQYKTPLKQSKYGNAEIQFQTKRTKDSPPFRRSTTFKWETPKQFPFCSFEDLMTKDNFCNVLESLKVTRVFILGDSLQQSLFYSLWKILEFTDDPKVEDIMNRPNILKEVKCPKSTIQISYTRNDQIKENKNLVSIPKGQSNCSKFCYPWTHSYRSYDGKTLLVANLGTHFQDQKLFEEAFDEFIRTVDSIRRIDDIVLFRTSVPGHFDCNDKEMPNKKKPFDSWFEYQPTITSLYAWNKFIDYNEYAERILYHRSFLADSYFKKSNMVQIELLDVYPMTVLRSDGHIGGEECHGDDLCNDCLHYNLPGPVDWWNHLMYNNLLDIAR